jgi:hypothetical protein
MKPQGTDESRCISNFSFVSRRSGGSDPLLGQSGKCWVELDAQPVTTVLLGYHTDGAGPEERVQDQPRLPTGVARARGLQYTFDMAIADSARPLPGLPTGPTDSLRTGYKKRP